jgi:hypothetical protein
VVTEDDVVVSEGGLGDIGEGEYGSGRGVR